MMNLRMWSTHHLQVNVKQNKNMCLKGKEGMERLRLWRKLRVRHWLGDCWCLVALDSEVLVFGERKLWGGR